MVLPTLGSRTATEENITEPADQVDHLIVQLLVFIADF